MQNSLAFAFVDHGGRVLACGMSSGMTRLRLLSLLLVGHLQAADCIAHRGDSVRHPDNTLEAVESAWKAGADIVELDVRMTGDGVLVLWHDADLRRKSIKEMTHPQLDAAVPEYPVPTLRECLKSAEAGQQVLLDLKEASGDYLQKVLGEVRDFTPSGVEVILQSGDWNALAFLRSRAPMRTRLFYVTNLKSEPPSAELAAKLSQGGFQGITAQGRQHVNQAYVAAFRSKGLKYYVWTINDPERMKHYVALGVDGVITDDPVAFRKVVPRPQAPEKKLPIDGEVFVVEGCTAFVIWPEKKAPQSTPWVWYAPTLPNLPGQQEEWMFRQWLDKGIAIAGIDVGESYGSPEGRRLYQAFYEKLTGERGMSTTPCLLARSRGGLMLYNWAVEHPLCVSGIVGIYPVCNLTSYPGLKKACGAYGMSEEQLAAKLAEHNPVSRLKPLAEAKVPVLHLHGDADKLVPLAENSAMLKEAYEKAGGLMWLKVIEGGGHDIKPHWFTSQRLVDFVSFYLVGLRDDEGLNKRIFEYMEEDSTWEIGE